MELTIRQNSQIVEKQLSIEDFLNEFISSLRKAETTKNVYYRVLRLFFSWVESKGKKTNELTDIDVTEYLNELESVGRSQLTLSNYLNVLRRFYAWVEAKGYGCDITKLVETTTKTRVFHKQPLNPNQVKDLLSYEKTSESLRDYALVNLMSRTGLRCVEVERANVEDITFMGGQRVLRVQGKGHKEKDDFVVLQPKTIAPILEYLRERNEEVKDGNKSPLFASESDRNNGGRLSTRSISRIVKNGLVNVGLDASHIYTAHSLRHSVATNIIRATIASNGNISEGFKLAQMTLRHANPSTTQQYTHFFEEEARLAHGGEALLEDMF